MSGERMGGERMGGETPVKQLKDVWCALGLGPSVHNKEFSKKTKN
jgi:hypothetical protein